jgi:hypothetical protein
MGKQQGYLDELTAVIEDRGIYQEQLLLSIARSLDHIAGDLAETMTSILGSVE